MQWTPRQLAAHIHFLDRELAVEDSRMLGIVRLAMHGKSEDVEKFMKTILPED